MNKDDEEVYYMNKYKLGYDVEEIALEIIEDDRFTNHEKANIFDDVTHIVFRKINNPFKWWEEQECTNQEEMLQNIDWKRFLDISKQYLVFCQTHEFKENDDVDFDIYQAELCIAIARAMIGDESELNDKIKLITKYMLNMINSIESYDASEWKLYTQFYDIRDIWQKKLLMFPYFTGIGYFSNIMRNLRKNHLILPSLIKCANALERKIKDDYVELKDLISTRWYPYDSENDLKYDVNESGNPMSLMYNWYRNIAEFAINAYLDTGLKNGEYFEIYTEYLGKMKSFTDNSYAFVDYSSRNNRGINFSRFYYQYETIVDICETYYIKLYQKGICFEEFKQKICEDKRLSTTNIISVCHEIAYYEFFEIDRRCIGKGGCSAMKEYLENNDWSKIEELLLFEEDIYLSTENFGDDIIDASCLNSKCDKYRVLLYAIKDNKDRFNEYMEYLFDDFKESFDEERTKHHWSHFTGFNATCGSLYGVPRVIGELGETFYWLELIWHQSLALPYMIKVVEYIHDWIKTLPNYSELMMYSWYKAISEFAEFAEFTVADSSAIEIYFKYQEKVDEMSGKDYQENLDSLI